MENEQIYDAINGFLDALRDAAEPLWPSATVPLPQRRNIGQYTIWPWTSLNTIVHKGKIISAGNIFDVTHEIQADLLAQATSDIRLAIMSAKKLSDSILECQRASAELLRQELNALALAKGIRASGDGHDLLLPVAYRMDRLKYDNWEVRHVVSLASRLIACLPDDMTLCRRPAEVSLSWRDMLTIDFSFVIPDADAWVSVNFSDRRGEMIDYVGLDNLARRLASFCPDPDSAVVLLERLGLILNLMEET